MKQNSSILLTKDLIGGFDGSKLDLLDVVRLKTFATQAARKLLETTQQFSNSDHFIIHFDEMQLWKTVFFRRNPDSIVFPNQFRKYLLIALTESLQFFKPYNIQFAISGTNVEQSSVLCAYSHIKTWKLQLPLFSKEAVLQLLDLFCNMQHLDQQLVQERIASKLAGCVRSCEYFFQYLKKQFSNIPPEQVKIEDLEKVN